MPDPYVNATALKTYLRNELGAVDDTFLGSVCTAATKAVNGACQRSFYVAGASSPRAYVPSGTRVLRVHDCTSVTSVTVDGTVLVAGTNYQTEPLNNLSWSGETVPTEQLVRIDGSAWIESQPGKATVSVVAPWGWSATPEGVVEAARIVAAEVARQRDVRFGIVDVGDAAGAIVLTNRKVRELLADYRRIESWGIG